MSYRRRLRGVYLGVMSKEVLEQDILSQVYPVSKTSLYRRVTDSRHYLPWPER